MLTRTLLLIGLIVSSVTNISWALEFNLPPISHFGYLGYDLNMALENSDKTVNHNSYVNWNISSYIIEPYIGQYTGGITLGYQTGDAGKSNKAKSYSILGNMALHLFPQSHFPFEAYWVEENQQMRQEQASLVTKRRRFGLVQRYTSKIRLITLLRVEYNEQEFDDRVAERNQFGTNFLTDLEMTAPLGSLQLSWRNQYRSDKNTRTGSSIDRVRSILRHTWRPAAHFSMNGFTSFRQTTLERFDGGNTQDRRFELNNFLSWRPQTSRPLLVSSIFRHVEFLGGDSAAGGLTNGVTGLTANANYLLSDRVTLQGNLSGSARRSDTGNEFRPSALLDGRYQSYPHRFGTFNYLWNAGLGTRWEKRDDEFGSVASGIGRLGHSLDKMFPLGANPLVISFSQHVSWLESTDGQSTQDFSNILHINWNRNTTRRSTLLSASISDNRSRSEGGRASEQDRDLQRATFLFSQTENLGRNTSLQGSVSLQIRRTALSSQSKDSMTPSGTADITYRNRMLLGVPLLQYLSTLRWYSSNFNSSLDDPTQSTGNNGMFWDNRLDYMLGRLDFRLLVRITDVNDTSRSVVFFSVRRNFGGFLN